MPQPVLIEGCTEHWRAMRSCEREAWSHAISTLAQVAPLLSPEGSPLCWLDHACVLTRVDRAVADQASILALRVREMTLVILDGEQQLVKTYPLDGASLEDVYAWLEGHGLSSATGANPGVLTLELPSWDALESLEQWISNTYEALRKISERTEGAGAVEINVSDAEITCEVNLPSREGEPRRFIEVSASFAQSADPLPAIWVRSSAEEGSTRSLSFEEITALSDGDSQAKCVESFLRDAIQAAYIDVQRVWQARVG